MTTVNFSVGPPPQPAYIAKGSDGNTIYQPNPQFWQWINLMWKWSTNFGNNANASIGGFQIGSDYIRDVANSFGLASTVTGGDDVRFWAGATYANRGTAPFRVYESGVVNASNLTVTGGSVSVSGTQVVSGTTAAVIGNVTSNSYVGLFGKSTGTSGYGVFGIASGSGGVGGMFTTHASGPYAPSGVGLGWDGGASGDTLTLSGALNGTTIPTSKTLVYQSGALGTPLSGTLTNCDGNATSVKAGYMVSPDTLKYWSLDNTQNGTNGGSTGTTYLKFNINNNGTLATVWVAATY